MNVLVFGFTGMVGQGVLRDCLADAEARLVQTVGRTSGGERNPKLQVAVGGDAYRAYAWAWAA